MSPHREEPLVVTDRRRALLQRSVAVALLLISCAAAAGASPERGAQLLLLAAGVMGSLAIARVANARVVADDAGLLLKRPTRSTRIGWPEVERFAIREPRRHGDPSQPVVELHDGTVLTLPGLDAPFALLRDAEAGTQLEAVTDLNERLRAWRSRMVE